MGYPPPPRRMGDKKRYYYNSNPNRRYGNSYMKNKYNKSFNNSNTHNAATPYSKDEHLPSISTPTGYVSNNASLSSTVRTTSSTSVSPHTVDNSPTTNYNSDYHRQSRYNGVTPHVSSTPLSRGSTSRYNADSEASSYRNSSAKPHHYSATSYEETDSKVSPPGKSRFEKSRYPSSGSASSSTSNIAPMNNSTTTSPAFTSSRYNASSYTTPNSSSYHPFSSNSGSKYPSSRYRPRTMETSVNATPLIPREHNVNSTSPAVKDDYQRTLSNHGTEASLNYNSTGNYLSRSNKWRNSQIVAGNTPPRANHSSENLASIKKVSQEKSTDKTVLENIFDTTSPPRSRYNSNVDPLDYSESKEKNVNKIEPVQEHVKTEPVNSTKHEVPMETKSVKRDAKSTHSSLIHSVAQTTREVERQASLDHKRIDLSRKNSDLNISHQHVKGLHNRTSISRKQSLTTLNTESETNEDRFQLKTMWTSSELSLVDLLKDHNKEDSAATTPLDSSHSISEENTNQEPSETKYEYICDTKLLKTPRSKLEARLNKETPLPQPLAPISECIFPMTKTALQLWMLKNQTRSQIISDQKYLLKTPIKNIIDYSFIPNNYEQYNSVVRHILLRSLCQIKRKDIIKCLLIKQKANEMKDKWEQEKEKLHEISNELRKKEIEFKKEQEEKDRQKEQEEKINNDPNQKVDPSVTASPGLSSRRRNRADFVDDTEMENILLKIDPEYKHLQAAASIPPLNLNFIDRNVKHFQNVNNLVTDKDIWASRILFDKDDNFTENEHSLFIDGYLMFPKKFGRISHHMGGLRTPEECVLHYYKTKKNVNYKELLLDKSKKRKESIAKRRKKKEKDSQHASPTVSASSVFSNIPASPEITHELTSKPAVQPKNAPEVDVTEEKRIEPIPVVASIPEPSQIIFEKTIIPAQTEPLEAVEIVEKSNQSNSTDEKDNTEGNKIGDKLEKIGDKDVIAIATAAVESIKETPILEKSDTTEDIGQNTTELTSTAVENSEPRIVHKKRPHEHIILAESSFDNHTGEPSSYAPIHGEHTNISGSEQADSSKLIDDKSSDSSSKPSEQHGKKKHKYMSEHKTSYWSVREAQIFPELLRMYGSQWSLISENLTTKSTTMVRNYYQRNAAQNGWKTIVDEADFRKDKETPVNTLQQTQFMFQHNSAQPTNIATNPVPTILNGVPAQQKPAMLFFDKQPNNTAPPLMTPTNPPAFTDYNKDVFAISPVNALPQPRLPSIQFPNTTTPAPRKESTSTVRSGSNENIYHPVPERQGVTKINSPVAPIGSTHLPHLSSSVFDPIRGNVERHEIVGTGGYKITQNLPPMMASTMEPNLGRNIATFDDKILHAKDNEMVRRGSGATVHSDTRTSSITALLNPMSQQTRHYGSGIVGAASSATESMSRTTLVSAPPPLETYPQPAPITYSTSPVQPSLGSDLRSMQPPVVKQLQPAHPAPQAQIQRHIPDFAHDPLAALAAVASAPETLASILPDSNQN